MSNSPSPTTREAQGSRGGQWRGAVPGPRPPLSRAQIDSTLARLEGLFGFIFALLSIPVLDESAATLRPEWAWAVTIALFGSIGVAFICSLAGRGVRISMGVVACVFVVTLVLWPLAVRSPTAAIGTQPWLWYIVIVAIGAAGISFSTFWAAAYTIAVPAIFAVLRVLPAGGGASWQLALLDAFYALLLGSFVVMVITTLRSTASQVDEAQGTAVRRYADAAKRHAAEQERTRVDTVIHDRVLSTLLAASRSRTSDDRRLAVQMARRALVALQSADAESEGSADLPLSVLVERSRSLAETLTGEIGFSVDGDLDGVVPARVIEGLYSATVQAIVNSIQHAGDGAARTISVHGRGAAGGPAVTVVVADTGAGFDVDAVPPDRLGVRISIRERVDAVGGAADIRSVVGAGTSIVISWPAAHQGEETE
ncbi:sensor histidine kinase [Herbiconiux ginsengi]|uniref:Signal transduction histidine kinase n=1 Tax=Herbiconiux ginsengi TaxID=381665 RepID=A0A1H3STM3_9MICO|nr:ATP-binding protein [Herbiconiux ginsengi]SDZ40891.1 Signal transduction histidine kinase [Herbiconiux ginsengi]